MTNTDNDHERIRSLGRKGVNTTKKKLLAVIVAGLIALMMAAPAYASQPPGQLGYEGHSGNQGGPQHHP